MVKQFTILALGFVLHYANLFAATYYVDRTAGLDNNPGTSAGAAWKTIAKVNGSTFSPGDHVLFKRGQVWREQLTVPSSGGSGTPIIFGSYGQGNLPIITAGTVLSGWSSSSPTNTYTVYYETIPSVVIVGSTIYLQNTNTRASLVPGQWFYSSPNLYVCLTGGNPDAQGLIIQANGSRAYAALCHSKKYVEIQDLEFQMGLDSGLHLGAITTFVNVRRCNFRFNGAVSSRGAINFTNCTAGGLVTLSLFEDNNTDGIYAGDSPNLEVSYCTFNRLWGHSSDHIQLDGSGTVGSTGGNVHHNSFFIQPDTDSVKGCFIVSSGSTITAGLLTKFTNNYASGGYWACMIGTAAVRGLNGSIIERNICVNQNPLSNSGHIESSSITANLIIRLNVVANANRAISFGTGSSHSNLNIYNNTVFEAADYGLSAFGDISGNIKNNIFWCPSLSGGNVYRIAGIVAAETLTLDHNCIGPERTNFIRYLNNDYSTLSAYKAAEAQDAHSISSNPQFRNAANSNFRLLVTSPCISAGNKTSLTADLDGLIVPSGTGYEIGAYEYHPNDPQNLQAYP